MARTKQSARKSRRWHEERAKELELSRELAWPDDEAMTYALVERLSGHWVLVGRAAQLVRPLRHKPSQMVLFGRSVAQLVPTDAGASVKTGEPLDHAATTPSSVLSLHIEHTDVIRAAAGLLIQ
jgi:hypothetical protein